MTLEALAELIRALRLYIRQLGTVSESPEQKHKANCVRNSQALPPSLAVCLCISKGIGKFHQRTIPMSAQHIGENRSESKQNASSV